MYNKKITYKGSKKIIYGYSYHNFFSTVDPVRLWNVRSDAFES